MARLVLVRHAPTPETGKRLSGRLPGVGLDDGGRRAAEATAQALAEVDFRAIYTSPVLRCRETARFVAGPHDLTPIAYRGLIEVDYGTWSGRTLGSLRRTKLWRQLFLAPSRVRFPGGERLSEVHARAVAACEELAAVHAGETVALVSHGDVIKAAIGYYLGVPMDLFQRIIVAPSSWSIVDVAPDAAPRVLAVNRVAGGKAA
jgi:probable phosphoglycerate mutase